MKFKNEIQIFRRFRNSLFIKVISFILSIFTFFEFSILKFIDLIIKATFIKKTIYFYLIDSINKMNINNFYL